MTFTSDLQKFAKKTGTRMDLLVKKVCLDLTRDLVKATPVDTGMARANYFFGFDRSGGTETTPSKNGRPTLDRATAFTQNLKAGGVFYITNNLPYILQITEYGTSTQMASGGITRIVARWQSIVEGAARGTRSDRVDFFKTGVE